MRREQGSVDVVEDEGVETLERDIHCGGEVGGKGAPREAREGILRTGGGSSWGCYTSNRSN